jgi:Raf kinase inhibitor-like YbhB/YbcL family protein
MHLAAEGGMPLTITSPAFSDGGEIPRVHTCDAEDTAPELRWSGVPAGAKSLALILDDPDAPDPGAPKMTYVHWVLYDIPPTATGTPAGAGSAEARALGAREGTNDWKRRGYGGPCPPIGRHRYFFKLHALDRVLGDLGDGTKLEVEAAMRGHILEQATLMGTYAH